METLQTRSDVSVTERLMYCPECKMKNIYTLVERLQYEEDRYWVFCTRMTGCGYCEEFRGKAAITEGDLIIHGLPGQLLQHMDIFYEDINKIVRFCMSEFIKLNYLKPPVTNYDFKTIKNSVAILAESHGVGSISPSTQVPKTSDGQTIDNVDVDSSVHPGESESRAAGSLFGIKAEPFGLEFLSQHSCSTQPYEAIGAVQDSSLVQADFPGSGLTGLSQTNQTQLTAEEELEQLFQSLCGESQQPVTNEEPTSLGDQESKPLSYSKTKNCHQSQKYFNPNDSMKKIADYLVADLPVHYQEDLKAAFSKINGYNFPQDFVNITTPDKLPLFKMLEERERQVRIKAEMDEQMKNFMTETDGFNSLFP